MPLVNVFIGMTLICFGVGVLCTMYGWGCLIGKHLPCAERAFTSARAAIANGGMFGAVALLGLLFV